MLSAILFGRMVVLPVDHVGRMMLLPAIISGRIVVLPVNRVGKMTTRCHPDNHGMSYWRSNADSLLVIITSVGDGHVMLRQTETVTRIL